MHDFKENLLAILVILMFTFWYLYTGYLLVDYLQLGFVFLMIGSGELLIIILAVLRTMHIMKKREY